MSLAAAGLPVAARAQPSPSRALAGAGATFPAPLYERWAAAAREEGRTPLAYLPCGSGEGLARLASGTVDFAASDRPVEPDELARRGWQQFPVVAAGAVPVVNLAGIASNRLRLDAAVLAGLFLGRITRWDDPALAALNPGLALPSARVTVMHRADASGTAWLLTHWLSQTSPAWRSAVGEGLQVAWPVGEAAFGNDGIASYVQRTRASIGVVEYAYARRHGLSIARLRNRAGSFVEAGLPSFEAAVAAAGDDLQRALTDLDGEGTWPLTGASFVVVRRTAPRYDEVVGFFDRALRMHGRDAIDLDYVPLPPPAGTAPATPRQ